MPGNDFVRFEFHRADGGALQIEAGRVASTAASFADLIELLTQTRIELRIAAAGPGSLWIEFGIHIRRFHDNSAKIADYATIFGLPIAILALAGVGQVEAPARLDDEQYATILKLAEAYRERSSLAANLGQDLQVAIARTGSDYLIIRAPEAPSFRIDAQPGKDPKPGKQSPAKGELVVNASRATRLAERIKQLEGVSAVRMIRFDRIAKLTIAFENNVSGGEMENIWEKIDQIERDERSGKPSLE